jgi:zinc protease
MGSLNVDEATFKSERDVVKEEFRFRILAPPYGKMFYALTKNSFVKHPYKRPGIGSIEELDAASIEDVRAFHRTFYRPDNAVLIVVGDFEQQQADAWIDKYFTPIPKPETEIPRVTIQEPARAEEVRVTEYAANVPLPAIALTWLLPAASHPDAVALALTSAVLGEGESSRLNEKLVRGEIAAEIYTDADTREDLGIFTVFAVMGSEKKPADAEKVIRAELASLAEKGPTATELEKAKNLIITGALRERETSNGKAFSLGESIVVYRDPAFVNTGLAKLQAVTPADVQRVAKKYLIEGKPMVLTYLDESAKPATAPEAGKGGAQ